MICTFLIVFIMIINIKVKYIINRFYKYDKSKSDYDSSGLGLSITKKIVEVHGGLIDANLQGDLFTFTII